MTQARTPFQHILVPTDGSHLSLLAGKLAVQLAAFHGACLTLVYVVDTAVVKALAGRPGKMAEHVEQELALTGQRYLDYLSRLALSAGLETTQAICYGVPYREIGQRGPRRILIGSVTERVIEHAPCAVLVVK
jgi:nucleotide-binding universal stress UspA family protein